MDEAKYCEDIIPQLKYDLVQRGFTNEHDRLGHFEAKVPIDVLFGIAGKSKNVRVFGIQFKSPKKLKKSIVWDLTHTPGQYEKIVTDWSRFAVYGLPWYLSLAECPCAKDFTIFVLPKALPTTHVEYIQGTKPLPPDLTLRLCSFFLTANTSEKQVIAAIEKEGFDSVKSAISRCLNCYFWDRRKVTDNDIRTLQKLGIQPETVEKVDRLLSLLHNNWLDFSPPITTSGETIIGDWRSKYRYKDYIGSRLTIRLHKDLKGCLYANSKLAIDLVEGQSGESHFHDKLESIKTPVRHESWNEFLAMIEKGVLGVSLMDLDLKDFRIQFASAFPADEEGLLVWYDHVRRVFYAVERQRLILRGEGILGTVSDPLAVGIDPDMRRAIFFLSHQLGLPASEIVSDIIQKYLETHTIRKLLEDSSQDFS